MLKKPFGESGGLVRAHSADGDSGAQIKCPALHFCPLLPRQPSQQPTELASSHASPSGCAGGAAATHLGGQPAGDHLTPRSAYHEAARRAVAGGPGRADLQPRRAPTPPAAGGGLASRSQEASKACEGVLPLDGSCGGGKAPPRRSCILALARAAARRLLLFWEGGRLRAGTSSLEQNSGAAAKEAACRARACSPPAQSLSLLAAHPPTHLPSLPPSFPQACHAPTSRWMRSTQRAPTSRPT